jgi:hypothetical protein
VKLTTAGTIGAAVAVALLLGVTVQVGKAPRTARTTATLARPKSYKANDDGRVYAVIQICWEPRGAKGAPHTIIGPLDRGDINVMAPSCESPYTRRGLVSPGDRVAVAWVIYPDTRARVVRWRITLNNVERMGDMYATEQNALHACIVGTPPC